LDRPRYCLSQLTGGAQRPIRIAQQFAGAEFQKFIDHRGLVANSPWGLDDIREAQVGFGYERQAGLSDIYALSLIRLVGLKR
jgi:hypothetical protein